MEVTFYVLMLLKLRGSEIKIPYGDSSSDSEAGNGSSGSSSSSSSSSSSEEDDNKSAIKKLKEMPNNMKNFIRDIAHNMAGTFICYVCDFLRTINGDSVQMLANFVQTVPLNTATDGRLTYSYSFLQTDGSGGGTGKGAGNRDAYTKVSGYGGGKKGWQKGPIEESDDKHDIKYEGSNERYKTAGFTGETEIPVLPGDIYNLAAGNVSLLDINFLVVDKELHENEDSAWVVIRNFATTVIHIAIYIAAAFLLTSLIMHGVSLARASLTPQDRVDHMKGITRFTKGIIMLIGTVVVMAISAYASQMFLPINEITGNSEEASRYEQPIRVNVQSGGVGLYSFSTSLTGYARYMAQIINVDLWQEKALYTFIYIWLARLNFFAVVLMIMRFLGMLVLAVLGPIVVIMYALDREENFPMRFGSWVNLYVSLAMIQVIMAMAYKVILEVSIL